MVNTIQYTDDVLWNYAPEICIILSTRITRINSLKREKNIMQQNKQGLCYQMDLDAVAATVLRALCSWAHYLASKPQLSHLESGVDHSISQVAMKIGGDHLNTTHRSPRSRPCGVSC